MATHIKDLIEGFFTKSKEQFTVYQRLDGILDKSLDKETRREISIETIRDRVLVLRATSSSARYNFNLQKEDALTMIKKEVAAIKDVVVRVV